MKWQLHEHVAFVEFVPVLERFAQGSIKTKRKIIILENYKNSKHSSDAKMNDENIFLRSVVSSIVMSSMWIKVSYVMYGKNVFRMAQKC